VESSTAKDVRAESLLGGRERAREPGRLAAEQPVDPTAPCGCGREAHVGRDLPDDEAQLLGAEARVERRHDRRRAAVIRSVDLVRARELRRRIVLEPGEGGPHPLERAGQLPVRGRRLVEQFG
jgi:hypothetical protein